VQDKSPVDLIEVRGVRSWSLSSVGVPSRVAVVGAAGSGKSAFAERLSRLLGIAHVELDALFWRPGWTPGPPDSFVSRVREVVAGAEWIVDGNYYSKLGDLVLARADTIIWLDYALPVVLWRLLRRTLGRVVWREELWNGNVESFRGEFLSRDSLLVCAVRSHKWARRRYETVLGGGRCPGRSIVRLPSPRVAHTWFAALERRPEAKPKSTLCVTAVCTVAELNTVPYGYL